jgi:predicted dehydrogenase
MKKRWNSNETVRWGIIGAGDVCEKKSGPALYKAPGSALQAITRRDAAAAEDFAARHGVPRWYTDPAKLVADPDVDVVYVATPPHLHRRFAEAALDAGKPVLVEKPMATTSADCDAMIERSIATGVPLWVAYYRRSLDKFRAIKELIDTGGIGQPQSILLEFSQDRSRYAASDDGAPWRVNPEVAGAGVIADMGSHMLDLVDWFLGPIASVQSVVTNRAGDYDAEDLVSATFTAGSGTTRAVGTALWDFAGRQEIDRTIIRGSEGAVEYSTFDDRPVRVLRDGGVTELPAAPFPPHVHQPFIESILRELRGGDTAPSTATSGARTNRVLDAIVAGYYSRAT